jgi:hypothetical protein
MHPPRSAAAPSLALPAARACFAIMPATLVVCTVWLALGTEPTIPGWLALGVTGAAGALWLFRAVTIRVELGNAAVVVRNVLRTHDVLVTEIGQVEEFSVRVTGVPALRLRDGRSVPMAALAKVLKPQFSRSGKPERSLDEVRQWLHEARLARDRMARGVSPA